MMTLPAPSKKLFIVIVLALVLIAIVFVGYRNREAINALLHLENANMYGDDVVLFYNDDCSHCAKVDAFIESNNVGQQVEFVKLQVSHDSPNANILEDKVQICGLDFQQIGVPFLWDGKHKKCVIGYVDIINFFRQNVQKP